MQLKSSRGVQQHDVDGAADALLAERARPTVERVRMKLGRGSPNTIAPMLEAWFAGLAPRLGVAPEHSTGEEAPPAHLRQALADLWAQALSTARGQANAAMEGAWAEVKAAQAALEAARVDLAADKAAALERAAALDQALQLARSQIEDLQARLAASSEQLAHARASLAGLAEERDAERRRADAQAQTAAQERQALLAREQATERRLLAEVDRAREDAKQARRELAEAGRRQEAAQAALQQRLQAATDAHAQERLAAVAATERLAASERRVQDLQGQLAAAPSTGAPRAKAVRTKAAGGRKSGV